MGQRGPAQITKKINKKSLEAHAFPFLLLHKAADVTQRTGGVDRTHFVCGAFCRVKREGLIEQRRDVAVDARQDECTTQKARRAHSESSINELLLNSVADSAR